MERKEIVYQHYVETCEITRNAEKNRNRLMLFSILCLFLFGMLSVSPDDMYEWFQELSVIKSGAPFPVSVSLLKTLILVIFLYCQVSYYQKCMLIERQYLYTANLEKILGITRESDDYNDNQAVMLLLVGWLYKFLLPILYSFLLIYSVLQNDGNTLFWIINILLVAYSIVFSVIYFIWQWKTEKEYSNKSAI